VGEKSKDLIKTVPNNAQDDHWLEQRRGAGYNAAALEEAK
jgi:hypothetical protein